jgi:acyl-CoA reductase-like NAD-dependent aldehyde dehydrogenase
LLVQSGIYDAFVTQFLEKVKSITKRMGNRAWTQFNYPQSDGLTRRTAMNPKSMMGSVISAHHLQRIHNIVEKRGSGTILMGGEPLKDRSSLYGFDFSRGSFYPPTVISDVSLEDSLWKCSDRSLC